MQSAFAPMRAKPGRGDCLARVERSGDSGLALQFNSCTLSFSTTELGAFGAAFAATREIFARFAADHSNATAIYGAGVALRDAGVVLIGASGAGKSILLLHLVTRGARFLGDETLVARWNAGEIRAQQRLPALREPGLAFVPSEKMRSAILQSRDVAHLRGGRFWYALSSKELLGISPDAASYPLRAIVHLQGRAAKPCARSLSRTDALRLVAERSYFKPSSLDELARIRRSLSDVRAFALDVGEPETTADVLLETLQCA